MTPEGEALLLEWLPLLAPEGTVDDTQLIERTEVHIRQLRALAQLNTIDRDAFLRAFQEQLQPPT